MIGLTLPTLRKILRCHFHEKSATELYQELTNMVQQPKEDPQSFLLRAMTTRQKIVLTSQVGMGLYIVYQPSNVYSFMHWRLGCKTRQSEQRSGPSSLTHLFLMNS